MEAFLQELNCLKVQKLLPKVFRNLNLFIDDKGGRLTHWNVPYAQKFPNLLHGNHRLTILSIEYYRNNYFHPGPQTLQ